MPWTNQGGNNNGGNGPWSRGPSGGGGAPPDLEELLRRSQHRLRSLLPGGGFTVGTIGVVLIVLLGIWFASGIYIVRTSEQGVVLRFGALVDRTSAGMHYHWPWPIEAAYIADVTSRRQISIGYHPNSDDNNAGEEDPNESLMLTGDENIIDVNFTVYWVVKDAPAFLFRVANPDDAPDAAIKAVLNPSAGTWLYFVTVNPKTGETKFTSSPAQFQQFREELQHNLAKS